MTPITAIIVYWTNAFIQHFPHPYYYVPGQNGCFRAILVYWVIHTVFLVVSYGSQGFARRSSLQEQRGSGRDRNNPIIQEALGRF